jgi:hypothetical protein
LSRLKRLLLVMLFQPNNYRIDVLGYKKRNPTGVFILTLQV